MIPIGKVLNRKINDYYDFFQTTFHRKHPATTASEAVKILGEVTVYLRVGEAVGVDRTW